MTIDDKDIELLVQVHEITKTMRLDETHVRTMSKCRNS